MNILNIIIFSDNNELLKRTIQSIETQIDKNFDLIIILEKEIKKELFKGIKNKGLIIFYDRLNYQISSLLNIKLNGFISIIKNGEILTPLFTYAINNNIKLFKKEKMFLLWSIIQHIQDECKNFNVIYVEQSKNNILGYMTIENIAQDYIVSWSSLVISYNYFNKYISYIYDDTFGAYNFLKRYLKKRPCKIIEMRLIYTYIYAQNTLDRNALFSNRNINYIKNNFNNRLQYIIDNSNCNIYKNPSKKLWTLNKLLSEFFIESVYIFKSKIFDKKYYRNKYKIPKYIPTFLHYSIIGWKKGNLTNNKEQTYAERYYDVKQAVINPLYHYERYGKYEGRYF